MSYLGDLWARFSTFAKREREKLDEEEKKLERVMVENAEYIRNLDSSHEKEKGL